MSNIENDMMAVGQVGKPQGLKGEVRVRFYNPDSEALQPNGSLRLHLADGSVEEVRVDGVRSTASTVIVSFRGITDRGGAERLGGAEIWVSRQALAPLEEGEFFARDAVGCRVEFGGEEVGTVLRFLSYPTCDVLEIRFKDGAVKEFPLQEAFVADVDVASRRVTLASMDGLE